MTQNLFVCEWVTKGRETIETLKFFSAQVFSYAPAWKSTRFVPKPHRALTEHIFILFIRFKKL